MLSVCCEDDILPISAVNGIQVETDYFVCVNCLSPAHVKRINTNGDIRCSSEFHTTE